MKPPRLASYASAMTLLVPVMVATFATAPRPAAADPISGTNVNVEVPPAPVAPGPGMQPVPPTPGGVVTRFIKVIGSGEARARPGLARIVFLVSTTTSNPLTALKQNGAQVKKVVSELVARGVAAANIVASESSLAVGAKGDGDATDTTPADSYTANARVQIVTYEVSNASGIVEIGMYAGATSVLSMSFEPRNLADLKSQALVAALTDAANKAMILALGVKVRVLYALSVSELPSPSPESTHVTIAPPAEVLVPMSIEVVYAVG